MKKILFILCLLSVFFSLSAQNSLCLNKAQKEFINFPKSIGNDYDLSNFYEAYSYYGKASSESLNGFYCVFKSDDDSNKDSNNNSKIFYFYKNGKKYSNILSNSENDFYIPQINLKSKLNREYLKFDNKGRVFISVVQNSTTTSGILMYSPAENHRTFFSLPAKYQIVEDFEIDSDGSTLIVNGLHSYVNEYNGVDSSENQAFLFDTSKEYKPGTELLYMNASRLSQIIYNPHTEAFYTIASFNDYQLGSDEMGKICVIRKKNNTFSKDTVEYYSQKQIENGNLLDFWCNNIVLNQLDNKIYVISTPEYTTIKDGNLCELSDNKTSLSIKSVPQTSEIFVHKNSYNDKSNVIQSTPIGLLIQDKNLQYFLYTNQIVYPVTKNDFNQKLADYNEKLFKIKESAPSDYLIEEDEIIESIRDNVINTVNDYYEKLEKVNESEELAAKYKHKNLTLRIYCVILFVIIIVLLVIIIYTHMNQTKNLKKEMQKKILELQESERAKLSRDIHDSVVQDIRAIRLQTDLIEAAENSKAQAQKERVIEDITQVIVKMRNICYNLTPAELATHQDGDSAEIELISILDSLSQQFYVKTKIPCSVQLSDELVYPNFDKETSLHLVRIYQEILNNIEKHSYATNVRVLIRNKTEDEQNYLVLFVIDDGIGCDIEQVLKSKKKNHFGLNNIRERVSLIGGKIDFFSSQNEGMKIIITVKM